MVSIVRWLPERESGDEAVPEFELVEAHFGLLPDFAENIMRTYNAQCDRRPSGQLQKPGPRHGTVAPCEATCESDWRTGSHVPTQITAANEETRGVVRLWSPWKNPANGAW